MIEPVYEDPVVAEIHSIRESLLEECNGDMEEYRRRVRERQAASSRSIVTTPLKGVSAQGSADEGQNQES